MVSYWVFLRAAPAEEESDSESEDEDDDEPDKLKALLARHKGGQRGGVFRLCCGTSMAPFWMVCSVITLVGCEILWEMGVLQPIMGQCIMYVYVSVVICTFVAL